jgi:hypothetical protein
MSNYSCPSRTIAVFETIRAKFSASTHQCIVASDQVQSLALRLLLMSSMGTEPVSILKTQYSLRESYTRTIDIWYNVFCY